ncbi:hypothetical protein K432DRAFT_337579 [Lepidopterella palustris CBS 459.81]|uniref:Uncharacterized protein n=1 Tax=Lepidopterella palustris CBS 459.81 TaxID=1314670 RepID=A0A8E2JAI6_9PEZI|nr:hypothetical protein K432DRAFT_337579 [Lepidopterella palustris CBS 459.81]
MLPPVDPSTLEQNPGFKTLYKDLCSRKLNSDGSSKDLRRQRAQDETRKKLSTARTEAAKSQILRDSLVDLPSRAKELPSELHEVIEIICAQLHGQIALEDREILEDDTDYFLENIEPISRAISTTLTTTTTHLALIANPDTPPPIPSLPKASTALLDSTSNLADELSHTRIALATLVSKVLQTHRDLLETLIRILEQTMHGSVARATRAQAELLAAKATSLDLQASIHASTHPPPPSLLSALKAYNAAMATQKSTLKSREQGAERTLQAYERAGGKAMLDISARYGHLGAEIEKVKEEIGRLERGE